MKNQIAAIIIAFVSFGAYAQHDHHEHASKSNEKEIPSFKDVKLGSAYELYIHLKDALVASNPLEVKNAAGELQKSLSTIAEAKTAATIASAISTSSDLNEQRKSFSKLSNEFTALVKANKPLSGTVYVAYCPMANNNEGAFWLSNEKEIRNPYFGDMMLRCGSVKEIVQ